MVKDLLFLDFCFDRKFLNCFRYCFLDIDLYF